jgi:hypothetical protein
LGKFKHPGPLGLPDKGNLDTMDELVAENYVDHNPPPFPGLAEGREGLKQSFKIFWKATPGHHDIEDQIAKTTKSSPVLRPMESTGTIFLARQRPATI